ncbi:MAG: PHP domain-containing protein [bacterium]
MGYIDLHAHSTASDGELSPAELVSTARSERLEAVALTDHDTMSGIPDFLAAALALSLPAIAGLELSAEFPGPGVLHLLVYGADPTTPDLAELLASMQRSREERGPRMLELLDKIGIHLSWEELRRKTGRDAVGKAHVARLLVDHGHVPSCDVAFERYLNWGRPAYVQRLKWSTERCLAVALAAGGVPVLAHPCLLERSYLERARRQGGDDAGLPQRAAAHLARVVADLAAQGLRGLEVYYPHQSVGQQKRYETLAELYGLLKTGGSDYHGEQVKPGIVLGRGADGDTRVPAALLPPLLAEIDRLKESYK